MFKEISTVLMFVNHVQESKEWYQNFLKIQPREDLTDFVSFKVGSVFFNLHLADELSPLSKGGAVAYFHVSNLKEALDEALSQGGQIYRGPLYIDENSHTIVQILDPFGNVFGLESSS